MITIISADKKPQTSIPEGHVKHILEPSADGTRVHVAVAEVAAGKTYRLAKSDRTQIVYIMEGKDAVVTHTRAGAADKHVAQRRSGVYLEPSEEATVTASATPLSLLLVTVPKHTEKAIGDKQPVGYFFEEGKLRALIDEKQIRERTFWVNRETGLSGSWDLQLGRMYYAPKGYSPRHVHHPSKTTTISPEHFYFIEKGTGEVKHDTGTLPLGPGDLVLIPAGE